MKRYLICLLLTALSAFAMAQSAKPYNLNFDTRRYQLQTLRFEGHSFKVRAFENIVYVKNPVDTIYQVLNIYIPEEYFEGKSVSPYTAATAPVFFPNEIGGYMPATPASAIAKPMGGMPPMGNGAPGMPPGNFPPGNMPPMGGDGAFGGGATGGPKRESAVLAALSRGYVVASTGARGRSTRDGKGVYTGKAPAAIVDLKAAIRYLKFNDQNMPGDANKIISNGTSAGGAMSALIGATGNNADYEPYLKALGAASATDDIFAVSAYCPITNLDHADMAYEWQFNGVNTFKVRSMPQAITATATPSSLSENQLKASGDLKEAFPSYLNSLQLKDQQGNLLTLDASGNGNFKELVKSYVMASAQKAMDTGTDLSALTWLKITHGKVTDLDFNAYVLYMERMKTPPAFDALDLSSGENQEFGTPTIDRLHFTAYGSKNSSATGEMASAEVVKMLNPMYYVGTSGTKTAAHWRIRHGTKDKDTGLAISVILGTYLQNKGYDVNLELPWDKPHSGDYDLKELFTWIAQICK